MSKQYGILNNELVVTNFKDFINGRLTLTNGVPIDFTDKVAQGTLYFTPYKGNRLSLYDTTNLIWRVYTFSQISLSLFGIVQDKNYDVFVLYNNGTLALELSQAWTDDTTRANSLVLQDGVYVKSGSLNKLWLGTIRASANNVCENSLNNRFVYNEYNKEKFNIKSNNSNATWTYNVNLYREINNGIGNIRGKFILGNKQTVDLCVKTMAVNSGARGVYHAAFDSNSTKSTYTFYSDASITAHSNIISCSAKSNVQLEEGYHYFFIYENAATSTITTYGQDNTVSLCRVEL